MLLEREEAASLSEPPFETNKHLLQASGYLRTFRSCAMVQRIDPTCGPLGRLRRKACCSYDACGVILFSVWIIASSVFLFKARQFYWHSWKSLKMQELYEIKKPVDMEKDQVERIVRAIQQARAG